MALPVDDPFAAPAPAQRGGRTPPHSLEAERAVIGGILLDATALERVTPIVGPDDFYARANQLLFAAQLELARAGRAIDLVTLRQHLVDRGLLSRVGGDEQVLALTETIPTVANITQHAEIVRDKAVARRLIQRCHEIAAQGYGDYGRLDEYLDGADEKIHEIVSLARKARSGPAGRSAVTRALELGARSGDPLPTDLESLDASTRGGLRAGHIVVLQGPPGAGKTSLAVQLARHYALAGHATAILACDEPADGLLIRWGQQEGLDRGQLERGEPHPCRYLADQIRPLRLVLTDADETATLLEDAAQEAAALAQGTGRPGVLVVDSLQTVRCRAHEAVGVAMSQRERIEITVRVLKHSSRTLGLLVIALSEVNRGAYRGGPDAKINPLAAGKDSSAIEYGCSLLLDLSSVPDESDLVHVQTPKNRLGPGKDPWRLRLDRDRAQLYEVPLRDANEEPDEAEQERRDDAATAKIEADAERLLAALLGARAKGAVHTSRDDLYALMRGRKQGRVAAVSHLFATGRLTGGRGKPITPSQPSDTPPQEADG